MKNRPFPGHLAPGVHHCTTHPKTRASSKKGGVKNATPSFSLPTAPSQVVRPSRKRCPKPALAGHETDARTGNEGNGMHTINFRKCRRRASSGPPSSVGKPNSTQPAGELGGGTTENARTLRREGSQSRTGTGPLHAHISAYYFFLKKMIKTRRSSTSDHPCP